MTDPLLFSIRIKGEGELLRHVPAQWQEDLLRPGARKEYTLLLEENSDLDAYRFPSVWSRHVLNGVPAAVYAPKGRADFALQYGAADGVVAVSVRKALDSYVRSGILYGVLTALHRTCVGLHGVTMTCGGRGVILSAPSGTGKTTLAKLLETHCGGRVINGDFALLALADDCVWFEPTPFCGTSGICLKERIRVDHVVFLSQAVNNRWQTLTVRQAMMKLFSNAFVPTFDGQLMQDVQGNILQMLPRLSVSSFAFAPTEEAARVFLNHLSCESNSSE